MAARFAELPLRSIRREYPNKLDHVLNGPGDVLSPRQIHPSFYGCFDWHSAVHGHWTLIRLMRQFELPQEPAIREALGQTLSKANLLAEAAYLDQPSRESFERTYGWAWLLKLAQELSEWDDPDGRTWAENLQPLQHRIVERYLSFLPRQSHPIRHGLHANTAFGLIFPLEYASAVGRSDLRDLIIERALSYYGRDQGFAAAGEPGGSDFLSPLLVEADLMRRVIPSFEEWFTRFLPDPGPLLTPVVVSDRRDGQIGHLDGLNLSRAWCLKRTSSALSPGALRDSLEAASDAHAEEGLSHIETGEYAGEHWLATFAVYLLSLVK